MNLTTPAARGRSAERTFRGYRLQLLYTLWRCLAAPADQSLRLEGLEDLDVLDAEGRIIEAVQVKAHRAPLTLSRVQDELSGPTSLRTRIAAVRTSSPQGRIRIASYSGFAPELEGFRSGDASAHRRVASRIGSIDGDISEALELEHCDEGEIASTVETAIRNGVAGADPTASVELLLFWLFQRAEARATITREGALERLSQVGRYVSARAAHAAEWFASIRPLIGTADSWVLDTLQTQFDNGVSVRYEHVVAGLDVLRTAKVEAIADAFEEDNVVIIHGASGQGKSCLAYRYMLDHVPQAAAYEIRRIADLPHAQRIALALTQYARQCAMPIHVYIDVQPGDVQWSTLLEELAVVPQVRVLVGIREEDWRRGRAVGASTKFHDIALAFDVDEARSLFDRFAERDRCSFVDFEEAWRHFGGAGPLLEFTYLLSHHHTLHARLGQQIATLRSEFGQRELTFAAAILTAGEFGCALDVRKLSSAGEVDHSLAILDRLEREYLVRTADDPTHVEGLHPVRSRIALDLLCDGAIVEWKAAAHLAMDALPDDSLETFLFQGLVRRPETVDVLARASTSRQGTWAGVGGVLRVLIWRCLRAHVECCADLIDEGMSSFPGIWKFMMFGNLVGLPVRGENAFIDLIKTLSPETTPKALAFMARVPPPTFDSAKSYLAADRAGLTPPRTINEWLGFAEVVFWSCFWRVREVDTLAADLDIEAAAALPLTVALSLLRTLEDSTTDGVMELRDRVGRRFRDEFEVLNIEHHDGLVRSDFVIRNSQGIRVGTEAHDEALLQIEALRSLYPLGERFGCNGHGGLGIGEHDETEKTGVPRDELHPRWGVHCNRMARNLAVYDARPTTWEEHIARCVSKRRTALEALECMAETLDAHFATLRPFTDGSFLDKLNSYHQPLRADSALPKQAIDPWGFATEADRLDTANTIALAVASRATDVVLAAASDPLAFAARSEYARASHRRFLGAVPQAPWNYAKHVHSLDGYLASVTSLIDAAGQAIAYGNRTTRGPHHHRVAARLGFDAGSPARARQRSEEIVGELAAMQVALRGDLGARMESPEMRALDAAERLVVKRLCALWHLFCDETANKIRGASGVAAQRFDAWLETKVARLSSAFADRSAPVRVVVHTRPDEIASDLWLVVHVEDRKALEDLGDAIDSVIELVLRDDSAMARATYSAFVQHLFVIPTFFGHTIRGAALKGSMLSLCMDGPVTYSPTEVEAEALATKGLRLISNPTLSNFEACVAAWARLRFLYERTREVVLAPVDNYGLTVRTTVRARLEIEWNQAVDEAIEATKLAASSATSAGCGALAGIPSLSTVLNDFADTRDDLRENPAWVDDADDRATHIAGLAEYLSKLYYDLSVQFAREVSGAVVAR